MIRAPAIGLLLMACMFRVEQWRDPAVLWADAAAKSPDKVRPNAALALAYLNSGRFKEAVGAAETAAPRFPEAAAEFLQFSGQARLGMGDYAGAADRFEWAAERSKSSRSWANAGAARHQGWLAGGGGLEEAMASYRKSRDESAFDGLADLMYLSGQWRAANGMTIDVRDSSSVYMVAKWLMLAGAYPKAAEMFERVPRDWKLAAFNEGASWYMAGDLVKSRASLERALALDPLFREARFNLGLALWQAGETREAVQAMAASDMLSPRDPAHLKFWRAAQEVHYGS